MIQPAGQLAVATATEARDRAERIRTGMRVLAEWQTDVITAYSARDWDALGYASWEAYLDGEFGEHRVRIPREQRREMVAGMTAASMSSRAIAAAVGVDQATVVRDRNAGDAFSSPASIQGEALRSPAMSAPVEERPVVGLDGKSYRPAASHPGFTPSPAPARPAARPPLPPQFQAVAGDLSRVIARVEKLQADDRYRTNRGAIATHCLPEIRRAASVLHDLLLDLGHDSGDPPA